jgi:hypothetical protein
LSRVPRIALLGRIRAGKDHVADGTTLTKHRMAQPIYQLVNELLGKVEKGAPGYRRFLQQVGQFGRGIISEQYPVTIERVALVQLIHQIGRKIWGYDKINWDQYGKRPDFWSYVVLNTSPTYNSNPDRSLDSPIIVNDLRFPVDKEAFEKAGFESWLVLCTEETRKERMIATGEQFDGIDSVWCFQKTLSDLKLPTEDKKRFQELVGREHEKIDVSEAMSTRLANLFLYTEELEQTPDFPVERVVWNDHREPPSGSILREKQSFLTTADFHARY